MAATIHARDLTLALGATQVLAEVSLSLAPGQRVGVVGPNGVGKSTLLRVLGGLTLPDRGTVSRVPPTATVGYLPQEPDRRPGETVFDYLARRTGVALAAAEMESTAEALAQGQTGAEDAYAAALDRWMSLGGADLDFRAGVLLADLRLGPDLADRPMHVLSGGEAARVSLASILLSRFDVLLLDEPTNDLDFDGLERLEDFVIGTHATLAVVSHDRAFLERVITDVVELDEHTRKVRWFAGGWSAFLENRSVIRRHAEQDYATYVEKRDGLRARAQQQRLWAMQGVRKAKRDTGEKDKHIKAFRIAASEKVAAKARATQRALERLDAVDKPWESWELRFEFAETHRSGDLVARLEGAVVRRGGFTLGPASLTIRWSDRVAVVGPNGAGKSTLLAAILGNVELSGGNRWIGPSVVVGVLDQGRLHFVGDETVLDGFTTVSRLLPTDARTLLAKFGLSAEHVGRPARSLSPGERTRASLALFQARGVNCLVLDEPTNHLDLAAIEQLESALAHFAGTVILVTHDRRLLERFAPTCTVSVREGQVEQTWGATAS